MAAPGISGDPGYISEDDDRQRYTFDLIFKNRDDNSQQLLSSSNFENNLILTEGKYQMCLKVFKLDDELPAKVEQMKYHFGPLEQEEGMSPLFDKERATKVAIALSTGGFVEMPAPEERLKCQNLKEYKDELECGEINLARGIQRMFIQIWAAIVWTPDGDVSAPKPRYFCLPGDFEYDFPLRVMRKPALGSPQPKMTDTK